jgi:hypothetical protein
MRGTVLHCSRFGAVIRLEDGRLALMPAEQEGMSAVRRATTGGRRPQFPFVIEEDSGRHVRLALAESAHRGVDEDDEASSSSPPARASSSLEQKIIDYLRQSAERDPRAAAAEMARADERGRPDRLLPFEYRARRQYRESPERPRRPKR